MELITSLWDSGILGGIATMIVTIVGQLSALNTQKFTAVLETLQKQQTADVAAHDAAFTRSGDGGVFVRRTMLFMAFAILGLCPFIFAFFEDSRMADWYFGSYPRCGFKKYLVKIKKDLQLNCN